MTKPWTYRPADPGMPDWQDNPLSNSMAWASDTFLSRWCTRDGHWSFTVTNPLWAECSCCLTFRGLVLGLAAGLALGMIAGAWLF